MKSKPYSNVLFIAIDVVDIEDKIECSTILPPFDGCLAKLSAYKTLVGDVQLLSLGMILLRVQPQAYCGSLS
jgi:hypothetical protein